MTHPNKITEAFPNLSSEINESLLAAGLLEISNLQLDPNPPPEQQTPQPKKKNPPQPERLLRSRAQSQSTEDDRSDELHPEEVQPAPAKGDIPIYKPGVNKDRENKLIITSQESESLIKCVSFHLSYVHPPTFITEWNRHQGSISHEVLLAILQESPRTRKKNDWNNYNHSHSYILIGAGMQGALMNKLLNMNLIETFSNLAATITQQQASHIQDIASAKSSLSSLISTASSTVKDLKQVAADMMIQKASSTMSIPHQPRPGPSSISRVSNVIILGQYTFSISTVGPPHVFYNLVPIKEGDIRLIKEIMEELKTLTVEELLSASDKDLLNPSNHASLPSNLVHQLASKRFKP